MHPPEAPEEGPPLDVFTGTFYVSEIRSDGDRIEYYGTPLVSHEQLIEEVWPAFRDAGYEVKFTRSRGQNVIVAEPKDVGVDGIPWTNVALFLATVFSTLLAGAGWYHLNIAENPVLLFRAWPFTAAVMGVLGVHELGHYAASRYYDVDASLPYFIPVPSVLGTMGAVIKMKGHIPNRKALFDIGIAGPLAGLVATVIVTVIGLHLDPAVAGDPARQGGEGVLIQFNHPPLLEGIAHLTGHAGQSSYHPVVMGGWIGMFITFLNMIPVGQLDGGHVTRAMFGDYQETIAAAVPGLLFAHAAFLYYVRDVELYSLTIWLLWGAVGTVLVLVGPVDPIEDEPIDRKRFALGLATFALAALCFTPVPVELIR